jgi:hypothetical protein
LKGAFHGDPDMIRTGINGGGNANAVLTKELGTKNFKFGQPHVDFPVAPAIHVAISGGTHKHLRAVHTLLMLDANLNQYHYEKRNGSRPIAVFHPAIYYGIGAFGTPSSSHAGLLQNLFTTYSRQYNHSKVKEWVHITGTPPPLHVAIMRGFYEGAYLLATMAAYDINTKDLQGLSALHVAAWLGNSDIVALLIHNGADIFSTDRHGRTFLHYVAMRGVHLISERMITNSSAIPYHMKLSLLFAKDFDGRTALDLALLPPAQMRVANALRRFFENATDTSLLVKNDTSTQHTATSMHPPLSDWIASSCASQLAQATDWGNRSALSARKIWAAVDSMDFRNSSATRPFADFFTTQRPVLIRGNLTGSMGFWKRGAGSRQVLLGEYGQLAVNVTAACGQADIAEGACFSGVTHTVSLASYLQRAEDVTTCLVNAQTAATGADSRADVCVEADGSSVPCEQPSCCDLLPEQTSLAVSTLPLWLIEADFTLWKAVDPFTICLKQALAGNVELRVARARVVVTPPTSSSAFWNVLLAGEQRHWFLLSPGAALTVSTERKLRADSMHPLEWVRSVFEQLRKKRLAVETVQRVGDVVFVPHGWQHVTVAAGEIIDLTFRFCTLPGNRTVMEQIPTGMRVYGYRANFQGGA